MIVENYAYHESQRDMAVPFRVCVRKNGEATEYRGETPAGATGGASRVHVVDFVYEGRIARPMPTDAPSALDASNLVAVTASVGSTLDALCGLMRVGAEVAELERARELIHEDGDDEAPLPSSTAPMEDSEEERGETPPAEWDAAMEGASDAEQVGASVTVVSHGAELPEGRQPALAARGRFEVTSRERLYLQLSRLPPRFHAEVAGAFGGPSLLELVSSRLAQQLLESSTRASELRAMGYPDHIVDAVKRLMATRGASSS